MASSKQIKGWIAANKKALAVIQKKIKKFEGDLKKAEVAEKKKKPVKKAAPKKKVVKKVKKKAAPKRKK
jgi:hypothetical protein